MRRKKETVDDNSVVVQDLMNGGCCLVGVEPGSESEDDRTFDYSMESSVGTLTAAWWNREVHQRQTSRQLSFESATYIEEEWKGNREPRYPTEQAYRGWRESRSSEPERRHDRSSKYEEGCPEGRYPETFRPTVTRPGFSFIKAVPVTKYESAQVKHNNDPSARESRKSRSRSGRRQPSRSRNDHQEKWVSETPCQDNDFDPYGERRDLPPRKHSRRKAHDRSCRGCRHCSTNSAPKSTASILGLR